MSVKNKQQNQKTPNQEQNFSIKHRLLSQSQQQFVRDVSSLIDLAKVIGVELTFGEAFRPQVTENYYVSIGRSHTTDSYHTKRLAIDFNYFIENQLVYKHEKIDLLGKFWEGISPRNHWGGNFKGFYDGGHFEKHTD